MRFDFQKNVQWHTGIDHRRDVPASELALYAFIVFLVLALIMSVVILSFLNPLAAIFGGAQ